MTRQPAPTPRVVSISMADGTPITGPDAQLRIARALLNIRAPHPTPSDTPAKTG